MLSPDSSLCLNEGGARYSTASWNWAASCVHLLYFKLLDVAGAVDVSKQFGLPLSLNCNFHICDCCPKCIAMCFDMAAVFVYFWLLSEMSLNVFRHGGSCVPICQSQAAALVSCPLAAVWRHATGDHRGSTHPSKTLTKATFSDPSRRLFFSSKTSPGPKLWSLLKKGRAENVGRGRAVRFKIAFQNFI